jgi:hypothetical protein
MGDHVRQLAGSLPPCPHPSCTDRLASDNEFWQQANAVHGMPPFGPRRTTGKRKTLDGEDEDVTRRIGEDWNTEEAGTSRNAMQMG